MNQMKRARCLLPGPAQREKPLSACLWGPAGCPGKGCLDEPECPTLCQRRESLSFTQSWAVTTLGSLLTWLWALNPQPVEKRLELEAGSFRRGSPPLTLFGALSPYLRGCQPLANSASGAQQAPGVSLRDSRVPLGVPALWVPSRLPAAAVASRRAGSRFPSSRPRLLQPGQRAIPPGLVQGASSASSGKVKCASWIAAAATAVAGDQDGWRRQPASWGGGRR